MHNIENNKMKSSNTYHISLWKVWSLGTINNDSGMSKKKRACKCWVS